jgi:radical SAM protein with 4Fe4S-binding SPASM domain
MTEDIHKFRDQQYSAGYNNDIKMVEINPIESCNRRCSFCPRSDFKKYPNTKNKISIETMENISRKLKDINFNGWISFVGFGEPLLHFNLEELIFITKKHNKTVSIEVNTNGDYLTPERIFNLYKSGCTNITVSMYDEDITNYIDNLKGDIPINVIYRHHYDIIKNYNLKLVNRSNITYGDEILNLNNPCYLPFYKLFIDWNGDVLPCANDWSRTVKFGNINSQSIENILTSDSSLEFKKSLSSGTRNQLPCSKCNACGTIRGEQEFKNFKLRYNL